MRFLLALIIGSIFAASFLIFTANHLVPAYKKSLAQKIALNVVYSAEEAYFNRVEVSYSIPMRLGECALVSISGSAVNPAVTVSLGRESYTFSNAMIFSNSQPQSVGASCGQKLVFSRSGDRVRIAVR